jgi:hypothetical protein
MANTIDSNCTALHYAKEETIGVLPTTPVWKSLEPNSYEDFGAEITNVAREPINEGRQRKKGTVTDLDASGGFNIDQTQNNIDELLGGFFFAPYVETAHTVGIDDVVDVTITTIDNGTSTFQAASGLDVFAVDDLVLSSGNNDPANDGLFRLTTVTAGSVEVDGAVVDDVAPAATSALKKVGVELATGDVNLTASATLVQLTSTATDFTALGLSVGQWIFVGGDAATTRFTTNGAFYARVAAITTNALNLEELTITATTESGAGQDIRIFYGDYLYNRNTCDTIERCTFQFERQLGDDGNGIQSEYLIGATPNEFTLNFNTADKLMADMNFMGLDTECRTGTEGIKTGTRVTNVCEEAINTSSNVFRIRMAIDDPNNVASPDLFAFVTEGTLTISNGVEPTKAIGTLGAFDVNAGDFEVGGEVTVYFDNVTAIKAVRNNSDVTFNVILANDNAGLIYDIPLMSLSDGRLNIEKDSPITIPLENTAFENDKGYTLSYSKFAYLPTVAMPTS